MNLGLTTSYIIAGILLLSILMMNLSVTNSSIQLTQRQMNQQKLATISDMLSHDIQKIGYNRNNKTNPMLLEADHNKIKFSSNIYDDKDRSVEHVTWELTDEKVKDVNDIENDNIYTLKRTVKDPSTGNIIDETNIRSGVTEFNISYYNSHGANRADSLSTPRNDQSDRDEIRQLYIKIMLESSEKTYDNPDDEGDYVLSIWEKRFSPPNLEET